MHRKPLILVFLLTLWETEMEKTDILIKNANELITLKGSNSPRIKQEMTDIGIIKNGSIAIKNGFITDIGKNLSYNAETIIDARGKTVMPGFVDSHTHLVFSGSREFELDWKLKGSTYNDIKNKGGGIFYTVEKTRNSSYNKLLNEARIRLDNMLSYGTTTCEAKTGYGLNTETELKILKVQKKLNNTHTVDIVSTFLGAHAIQKEQTLSEVGSGHYSTTFNLASITNLPAAKSVVVEFSVSGTVTAVSQNTINLLEDYLTVPKFVGLK